MIGWGLVLVGGLVLGLTSYWHGQAGMPGTTGAPFVVAALVALVAFTAAGVWAGKR
jgi:hypothetical protein